MMKRTRTINASDLSYLLGLDDNLQPLRPSWFRRWILGDKAYQRRRAVRNPCEK